ncbi:hypothetical protein HanXRQr2_Chr00c036g0833221 [Helianthus annuus]|nr:hypothetical protein HanXRQr2_Chr00c036g0833221 [Helianthus annuus]KAJ0444011.1 hypothetical protein HanIR_Chr16g0827081 [Helianthus annuus]
MEKAGEDRLDRIQVTLTEISESLKQLVEIVKTNLEEEGLQEEDQTEKKRKCVDGSSMAAVHVAKDEAAIVNKRQSSFFKKRQDGPRIRLYVCAGGLQESKWRHFLFRRCVTLRCYRETRTTTD